LLHNTADVGVWFGIYARAKPLSREGMISEGKLSISVNVARKTESRGATESTEYVAILLTRHGRFYPALAMLRGALRAPILF
jgi:hypothetical protein